MQNLFLLNDTPPTDIYTLSLHDALPISPAAGAVRLGQPAGRSRPPRRLPSGVPPGASDVGGDLRPIAQDRKSTRLNSSHSQISYAVFCLKKKKNRACESPRGQVSLRDHY